MSSVFQEKGGAFSGMFKKSTRLTDSPPTDEVRSPIQLTHVYYKTQWQTQFLS